MKPKYNLLHFLAIAGSSLLAISSANAQATYYWDGNNDTTGYGTAGGTWANPTTGTLTSGWTTAINGDADIVGNSITTTTSDTLTFGRTGTGFSLATGTITVSGTVNSGNMNFGTTGGTPVTTLTGGTINFGNAVTIGMSNLSAIIESQITGASTSISKTGSTSTLRFLNTNNSYTGLTSIIGTLVVTSLTNGGSNSSIGASSNAASNLIIGSSGGGTLSYIGSSNASTDRLFTLGNSTASTIASNGDGTLNFTNTGAIAYGTADQTRTLTLTGTNTGLNILSASIGNNGTGAVSFTKSGAGNWVLANNSSSYTGQTSITNGGTLSVSKMADYGMSSAIGHGTAGVGISFNGSLVYTGTGDDTNRLIRFDGNGTILNNGSGALNFTETGNFNVQVTNNSARTFTLGGTNGGTISGAIQNNNTGVVSFAKTGSGSWALNGASSYTGTTVVQQGNLIAGTNAPSAANGAFGNASSEINLGVAGANDNAGILIGGAFTVGRNVRLLTSNNSDAGTRVLTLGGNTAANSEFSGNIFLGTNSQAGRGVTLTAASGGQVTFSGVIQNPTSMDATTYTVTKAGLGTVVLSNANTYSGVTNVNQGTLLVNNTTGSGTGTGAVIVATGGTLGGSGIISGNVTTQDGGTFAAGTSIESLATGSLTQEAGSTFAYEANNNAAAALAGDLTAVTGNLTFDLTNAAILTLTELGSGSWADNEKLTLLSYTGTWNGGLFEYLGNTVNDDSSIVFSGYNWTFNYNDTGAGTNFTSDLTGGSFVTMTAVSAIPEPGAALLGSLGVLLLLRRRR